MAEYKQLSSITTNCSAEKSDNKELLNSSTVSDLSDNVQSNMKIKDIPIEYEERKTPKHLYIDDRSEPKMYDLSGSFSTPTLITKNLPDQFNSLPIYGQPKNKTELPEFNKQKIRQFVGNDLNDEEFEKLSKYCSPDHLRTGCEVQMLTPFPTLGAYQSLDKVNEKIIIDKASEIPDDMKLNIHKKLKLRIENDTRNIYCKKLKYRGIRFLPVPSVEDANIPIVTIGKPLEPGKELLFRVRLYRPYVQTPRLQKRQSTRVVFTCDLLCVGRQPLTALRDRIVCVNDVGLRIDRSEHPDREAEADTKTLFPSGFLFINNVFYVDTRAGCVDLSVETRAWAANRGYGDFPVRDMSALLQDIPLRIGHPEVYIHQGDCEHLFTFSEVRLMGPSDASLLSQYPLHTAHSQSQTVYCTTCGEFSAKWIVTGCNRVPFDPAFFCDTCFKLYLYVDGKKIGDFKAYPYKANELSLLKPQGQPSVCPESSS